MKIGFISGDLVEIDNTRSGVSVPDYPVQGHLMRKWVERGHEVVLLTRFPRSDDTPPGITLEISGDTRDHDLDVLFGDRLGVFGSEWDVTLRQIERYRGPIVYHQYVPYSGWAPPFRTAPHLLGIEREWTIINRSPKPKECYAQLAGFKEQIPGDGNAVNFRTWRPFLMREYPWREAYVPAAAVTRREYWQGYYGRVPKTEKRAKSVSRWLTYGDWSRAIYGPETSTAWVSASTGAVNGGRIMHRDLPEALLTFNTIVQSPIDRLRNKGSLEYWPHRFIECAMAGIFQLFDREIAITEFDHWRVTSGLDLHHWMHRVNDLRHLKDEILAQQEIILPRANPNHCHDELNVILEEACAA